MPISKVDKNMQTAQKRDACLNEKFYFRTNIFSNSSSATATSTTAPNEDAKSSCSNSECELAEMSINEIVNGSDRFIGLIRLINDYLSNLDADVDTQCTIKQYLKLIEMRASGKLMTNAAWIRKFVMNHPKYKQDSYVDEEINYDLLWRIYLISSGQIKCPELLHSFQTKSAI
jgi:glutamate--cysteine ligase catalytic subunit